MEQITNYVKPELIVVAIALYFVGMALKQAQAVKDIAAGKMSFTMFMDRKELAKGGAQMAIDYLTGEKVDVKDYSQYDNGVKIVGTFTCGAQMIDKDNYQILVDNGTYTEDEIAPDPTPTPEVTPAPEATPVPKVTLKTASEEDSKEVTPTPETEDKSEGETRENLIYDSEDNSKVEKTSDQKKIKEFIEQKKGWVFPSFCS